jgi:tetraacyldisaccharide 4'-kinase
MTLLAPLGVAYGAAMQFRSWLYNRGLLVRHSLGRKTISIGNLTVGGTGKTPVTRYAAEILAEAGQRPCILTRGYGRQNPASRVVVAGPQGIVDDADLAGDEPLELAKELQGRAIIIADADRVAAAEFARREFSPDVFILDDGFQHLRAKRDLDLLLIDATNPFGNGYPLPAGILRENLAAIARADAVIITRTEIAGDLEPLKSLIRRQNSRARVFEAAFEIAGFRPLANHQKFASTTEMAGRKIVAFCGIANPNGFRRLLAKYGIQPMDFLAFGDHQRYSPSQIASIGRAATQTGAETIVTTEKDAVKLLRADFPVPCYSASIAVTVNPVEEFRRLLLAS